MRRFVAKIGESNEPSLRLFHQLHFNEVGRSTVFKEVTLEVHVKDLQKELFDLKRGLEYSEYHTKWSEQSNLQNGEEICCEQGSVSLGSN